MLTSQDIQRLNELLEKRLEKALGGLEQRLEATLEQQLEQKLGILEQKLDGRLDEKLEQKFDEKLKPILDILMNILDELQSYHDQHLDTRIKKLESIHPGNRHAVVVS